MKGLLLRLTKRTKACEVDQKLGQDPLQPAALLFNEAPVHPQDVLLSTCHSSDTRVDVCYVRDSSAPVASRDDRRDTG